MSHDLFDDVVRPSVSSGANRWRLLPLSIVTHAVIVGALILMPLTAIGVFPTPESALAFAPPAPPRPVPVIMRPLPAALAHDIHLEVAATPPPTAPVVAESLKGMTAFTSTIDPVAVTGPPFAVFAPPPADDGPVAVVPDAPAPPVRVGGVIGEPRRVHYVAPVFPAVARASRSEGMVILEVIVGSNGLIREAVLLRGHPMFDQAALDAVRQWRYTPTTLNGSPIDVTMTVTVRFSLN